MSNVLTSGVDTQSHIRHFNIAWNSLHLFEQTQLIEELRARIARASLTDSGIILSNSAYLWYFWTSLKVCGCLTDEFTQFFGSYYMSWAREEIDEQISGFFEGILPADHSPDISKLVVDITTRTIEALQK